MIRDILEQMIRIEDEDTHILIVYVKPRNKDKVIVYDTDHAGFDIIDDALLFDFWMSDYKSFTIDIDKIKDVTIENFDDNMIIAHLSLDNGNTIMIHFMKD